jgi:8-oxo-dGTP pyrophosphatase MutT (NUDIX family)
MKTDLVIGGLLIHNKKVLLIHHKKLNSWLPPGGHIEKDETPDEAVEREFEEELGLEIEILNRNDIPMGGKIVKQLAVPFYVNVHNVGDHNHCCFFYLCVPKNPEKIVINKSEVKEFGWFSREELYQKQVPVDVRNIAIKAFELFNCLKK